MFVGLGATLAIIHSLYVRPWGKYSGLSKGGVLMSLRLFALGGILVAVLALAACDNDYRTTGQVGERITNTPGQDQTGTGSRPFGDQKVSLRGSIFTVGDSCFYMVVGDSAQYELVFVQIEPPTYDDGTSVTITGEYSAILGSRCGVLGLLVDVEKIDLVAERSTGFEEFFNPDL